MKRHLGSNRHILLIIVFCVFIAIGRAYGTDVGGDVWGSWGPDGNPYRVIDDLRVPPESSLQISPGCQIMFQGYYEFIIDSNATLTAIGAVTDSIIFTALDDSIGWGGIRFYNSSGSSVLRFCRLEAGYAHGDGFDEFGGAIFMYESPLTVSNCNLTKNRARDGGAIYCYLSNAIIENNQIINNRAQRFGGGIKIRDCDPQIINNLLSNNRCDFKGGAVEISFSSPRLSSSSVYTNTAQFGGGIFIRNASPILGDSLHPCNIYDNSAGFGGDLMSENSPVIVAFIDTFTLATFDDYLVHPQDGFDISIMNGYYATIDQDVYVSIDGDNSNDGTSPLSPLKNIRTAIIRIQPQADNQLTIHLLPGVYGRLTNQESFPLYLKSYISISGDAPGNTEIDGFDESNLIFSAYDSLLTLRRIAFVNGSNDSGGCIYSRGSIFTIENSIFYNSRSDNGGAIYLDSCSASLIGNHFSSDSALMRGGAIYAKNGEYTILNSMIDSNTARNGGGIFAESSHVRFDSTAVSHNHASGNVGGVFFDYCPGSTIIGNIIAANSSDSSYGGGYFSGDSLQITGNRFESNSAANYGGGLGFASSGIRFNDNIIRNNSAIDGGGLALMAEFYCQMGPNLITENHVAGPLVNAFVYGGRGRGGGIYSRWADIDYRGTTISFNTAYMGGGIFRDGGSIISIGDPAEPCNIYSNLAGCGNDLYASGNPIISTYIDTFTIATPNQNTVFLLNKFDLHIEHGYYEPIEGDIYVSPQGDNFNDGVSPLTPLRNINIAMIRSQSSSEQITSIFVLPGRYSPSLSQEYFPINFRSGAMLLGESRDSCIIDGEYAGPLFALNLDSCITIKNLSLINGRGALIINSSSSVEVNGNLFADNRTDQMGAGICSWWCILNLNHNVFTRNSTIGPGAGGGALCLNETVCRLENNTFYLNTSNGAGGALWAQTSNILAGNNILWRDTTAQGQSEIYLYYVHNMYEFRYNDIQGGFPGDGNIDVDPAFIDPDNGNFHLMANSPCVDTGDPRSPLDPDSTRADMGAYFYDHRVGIDDLDGALPLSISLQQNYPNPFNDNTIIRYTIDKRQSIRLEIFDVAGRLVTIIQRNEVEPGLHEVTWDGKDSNGNPISSGLYFYKLNVGSKDIVKKMILLK